tara:strand:+ start:253 stop:576 length:324 start_codon:yes stop_codon:yes gene_type:complete
MRTTYTNKKEIFDSIIAIEYDEKTGRWYKDNISIERTDSTNFKVYVWEGDEVITCDVPSVVSLINFLTRLFGIPPAFKTSKDIEPTKTGLVGRDAEGSMKGRKIQDK